jgi:CubicO group peptidase (beta-lactamase class C family)
MKLNVKYSAFFILLVAIVFSSCQLGRFVFYNFADIKDYKVFPKRELKASTTPFTFFTASKPKFPKTFVKANKEEINFEKMLEGSKTVAFLIIQNDSIQFEKYYKGYDDASIVPSFSMSKSITSALIGCAIDDGLIKSVDEPITNYIPEMKKNGFDKVSIKHVLQMTTGLKFNEGYFNPFGHVAAFYYGRHLEKQCGKLKLKKEPGTEFEYKSGNTQLLGLILARALKTKTVTQYLQEKIWTPLNMEYDASWSIDKKKNGLEKTFCCINARARDFAKFGRLYLNKGNWDGKQLISKDWVTNSTKIDTTAGSVPYYQYQWWIPSRTGDFMAIGILGQYVYVNPAKNLIIVRLGKKEGGVNWWSTMTKIAGYY